MKIDYIKILLIGLVIVFIVATYNLTREKSKFGTCYDVCTKKLKEKNKEFKNFCSAGLYPVQDTENKKPDGFIPVKCSDIELACLDACN